MPNQYAKGTVSILVRLPEEWKDRLQYVTERMNIKYPGANFSSTSIARQCILEKIEQLETELGISPKE